MVQMKALKKILKKLLNHLLLACLCTTLCILSLFTLRSSILCLSIKFGSFFSDDREERARWDRENERSYWQKKRGGGGEEGRKEQKFISMAEDAQVKRRIEIRRHCIWGCVWFDVNRIPSVKWMQGKLNSRKEIKIQAFGCAMENSLENNFQCLVTFWKCYFSTNFSHFLAHFLNFQTNFISENPPPPIHKHP